MTKYNTPQNLAILEILVTTDPNEHRFKRNLVSMSMRALRSLYAVLVQPSESMIQNCPNLVKSGKFKSVLVMYACFSEF